MLKPSAKQKPTVKPKVKIRRLPVLLLQLLEKSEPELEQLIQRLESDPLFAELISAGVVERQQARHIPKERLDEHRQRKAIEFLQEHGIAAHPDWEKDLLSPSSLKRVQQLAEKYGVPPQQLSQVIRSLQAMFKEEEMPAAVSIEDVEEPVATEGGEDIGDAISVAEAFVKKYGLTEEQFREDVLEGGLDEKGLVQRYGCSLEEAKALQEAILHVQVLEMMGESVEAAPLTAAQPSVRDFHVIAKAEVTEEGTLRLEFSEETHYGLPYRIDEERLRALLKGKSKEQAQQIRDLVTQLEHLNQHSSTLIRTVESLCHKQLRFLMTGDPLELRPLSQSELARMVGHHRSVISRLLRGRGIQTPHGTFSLSHLCQSKSDVVKRIAKEHPDWTDKQLTEHLQQKYGTSLARRTVAYHRQKAYRKNPERF